MNISRLRAEVAQVDIPPLTCTKRSGEPYKRFSDIENEIRDVISGDANERSIDDLKSETLVFFIRRHATSDDADIVGHLVTVLGLRTARVIEDNAQGFDSFTFDQIANDVSSKVIEMVFEPAPSRQGEYLEIAFREKVKQWTLNHVEHFKGQPRISQFAEKVESDTGLAAAVTIDSLDGNFSKPEDLAISNEIVESVRRQLPLISNEKHRDAVILRHLQGWPFTSTDDSRPTLCQQFGVSRQTINSWIDKAFGEMRLAMEKQND